jgi:hypothetical protein
MLLGAVCLCGIVRSSSAEGPAKRKRIELPGPSDVPLKVRTIRTAAPADFRSTHFLLHTDLAPKDARELLHRLEVMLGLISKYWNQPPSGIVECYVVDDLKNWPPNSLDPAGRRKIEERAGVTLTETISRGKRLLAAKAVVYAVAERGTPEHEAVHAYCGQTFGRTGPLWYAEGMAEMGQYWQEGDPSVHCHPHALEYLRAQPAKPLAEILADDRGNKRDRSDAKYSGSWQDYAWRWALCHMLANNTNYAERFRPLGLGFLTGQRVSFADTYGAMTREIDFEFDFFRKHLDQGYRVDLCSWDWKRKFRAPNAGSPMQARVAANRGWQPSGMLLSSGNKYDYSASGVWQTNRSAKEVTADGQDDGTGRLEGILFKDFVLGEPFSLGTYGSFTSPGDGQLFLRSRDTWSELADNKGSVTVKIKNAGQGTPLARPNQGAKEPADESAVK